MDLLPYILPCFIGVISHPILNFLGMTTGLNGVNYYAEVHTSLVNSIIHSIFMPFTIFGILLWFPTHFTYNIVKQNHVRLGLYIAYITHYLIIDVYIAGIVAVWYIPSLYYALYYTNVWTTKIRKKRGFLIATIALIIQEYFGHYLGGDAPSRLLAIPNAIIYACYYSVSYFAYNFWFILILFILISFRYLVGYPKLR